MYSVSGRENPSSCPFVSFIIIVVIIAYFLLPLPPFSCLWDTFCCRISGLGSKIFFLVRHLVYFSSPFLSPPPSSFKLNIPYIYHNASGEGWN